MKKLLLLTCIIFSYSGLFGQTDSLRKVWIYKKNAGMFFTSVGYNKAHDVLDSISKAKNIKIYLCVTNHWIYYMRSLPDSSMKWEDIMTKKGYFSPNAKEQAFKDSVTETTIKLTNWHLATTSTFIQNNNLSEGLVLNLTAFKMAYLSSKDTSKFGGKNYAKISISASPNLPANIKNKYSDLAGDLPFELTENQIDNDKKLITWLRDLDNIMSGSNAQTVSSGTADNNIYFLEARDTFKLQDKSSIYRTRQDNRKIVLRVRKIIGTFDTANTSWEVEGKKVSLRADTCVVILDKKGSLKVEVFENNKKVAKLTVVVYAKPTLIFKVGSNYNGEYGFDDVHSKEYAPTGLKADYQKIAIEKVDYYTSLVSVIPNQPIILNLEYENLVSNIGKDNNFRLRFVSSNTAIKLGINEVDTLYRRYNELNINNPTLRINVKSTLDHNNYTRPDTIKVYDHLNALVGQIHIFCDNVVTKYLVFVYVNNGNGYNDADYNTYVSQLNDKSFNQVYIRWNVTKDTMNLSANPIRTTNSSDTLTSGIVANSLKFKYSTRRANVDLIDGINNSGTIYY